MPLCDTTYFPCKEEKAGNYYLLCCSAWSLQLRSDPARDGMVYICSRQKDLFFFKEKPKKPKKPPWKRSIKINTFTVETFGGLQEHVKDLHKVGGRKTLAAQVLQKGQGLALHTRSAG